MNNLQRKRIERLIEKLEAIRDEFYEMAEEEQEKFDNMPESLQDSERGEALQEGADNLQEQADAIDDAITNLQELL